MAPALGKRKRVTRAELEQPSSSPSPSSGSGDESGTQDLQAIFRRAFEAKFKPLPVQPTKPKMEETRVEEDAEEEEEEEETDWSGISDNENGIQVIEYQDPRRELDEIERAEMKAFMSSKPPTSASASSKSMTTKKKQDDTDSNETTNLKNDMALQKLLRESHLLSASSSGTSTPTLTTTGVARHKSQDLHFQALGAKGSIFTQKKMPMAQRKHMIDKARTTEEKRRKEAKEAGIVLERENRVTKKAPEKKRERGVGGPSIGKFRGGTLSLSKKDVQSITGGGGSKGKGKGKKGKR